MFRRAVGSLLARRFSPRVIPKEGTAPARSLHSNSLRDLALGGDGLGLAAAALAGVGALAGGGALAVQHFKKGTVDDGSAARKKKEEDMKAIFEEWIKRHNKSYHDEEDKARRFQLFKAALDKYPRPLHQISYFADLTRDETRMFLAYPDGVAHHEEFQRFSLELVEKMKKGEPVICMQEVKQDNTQQATGDSA